ncbi:hypothetical protein Mapa_015952 [Marchantia paleacea]|nr:hypothetical protein Mapa_015952 [Marchantia paleacea]
MNPARRKSQSYFNSHKKRSKQNPLSISLPFPYPLAIYEVSHFKLRVLHGLSSINGLIKFQHTRRG